VQFVHSFLVKYRFFLLFFVAAAKATAAEQRLTEICGAIFEIFSLLEVFYQNLFGVNGTRLIRLLHLLFIALVFVDRVEFFHHSFVTLKVCDVAHNF